MAITVLSADEYQAQEFDAVLVRERTVLCIDDEEDRLRMIPLEKVNHVDAAPETMLSGRDVPESFYGGCECGFVETESFPDLQEHMAELDRDTV
ncbi:hypothetical protein BRD00_05360 [Halobacteriales archaeon QS_8_69_26]|nr:MAG: hypothetical protein BRD00_05360 [Halobacteriales archaeon QS_8_69_26]